MKVKPTTVKILEKCASYVIKKHKKVFDELAKY